MRSFLKLHGMGMTMKVYDGMPGEHISATAQAMVALADKEHVPVHSDFNGIGLVAQPGDEPSVIAAAYNTISEARAAAYRVTPEYQRRESESAAIRERQRAAADDPLPPFTIRDQVEWAAWKAENADAYGAATFRYAQRWAGLMEREIRDGAAVAAIAKRTSHEADTEGVSGWMVGAAGSILARCWVHGDELEAWRGDANPLSRFAQRSGRP